MKTPQQQRKRLLIVSVLALGICAPASTLYAQSSEQAAEPTATLAQSFERAKTLLPDSAALENRKALADAQARASSGPLVGPPSLDADIFTTTDQFEEQEARVSGALRWRGEGQAGQREARATRALADARLILAQWRLAGDVRNAWWAAVLANQSLLFEQELRELVAERLEATKNLVAEGLAADLDLAQARSDLELAEQSVARARLQRATALSLLMSLTGENVKLPSDDLPQAEPRIADLVLAEHPVVKIASLSEQQAQASADRLGYEARPRISASLGARRERSPVDGRFEDSVLVGVSVPLGKNPRTQADQAAAQTSATIAAAQARRAEIRLGAELKLAEQRIALTQAQLKSAERSAQALEGALELTRRGYEEGEFSYITLSQARTRWAEARRAMIQAQIAQRASISAYNQAAGALPR